MVVDVVADVVFVRLGCFGVIVGIVLGGAQPLFLSGVFGLLTQQSLSVSLGNLIIVGMDFAEGEKAVAVAAIIDERRLERRFDPGDLG